MRATLQPLLLLVSAAGLLSCGDAESRGDSPTCGGGFAEETAYRYGEPEGECHLLAYFTGVVVLLPATSVDRGWVLSGRVGEESFTCAVAPGMLGSDRCSDNPQVDWFPQGVLLRAHPCDLSLHLEVDGKHVASGSFEPAYEWDEPNGVGCGWAGEAHAVLSIDGA